ncbi:MAG: hypothetical protein IT462_13050 [Planctomycetes bacterium]|nr:hypothetical protein [Planctomycetota bacterium]
MRVTQCKPAEVPCRGKSRGTKAGLDAAKKANPKLQVDWREEEGACMGLPG